MRTFININIYTYVYLFINISFRAETWRALEDLKKEGKLKSIGVSNFGILHLKKLALTSTGEND
jgi:diketogulonate reductase-like aldo/keto reductase